MTQKQTPILQEILKTARIFAAGNGAEYAETQHVLAGMLSVNDSFSQNILTDHDVTIDMALAEIESQHLPEKTLQVSNIKFSPKVVRLLSEADAFAQQNHLSETGSEHLLYILLTDDDNVAKKLLELNKIKTTEIVKDLVELGNLTVKKVTRKAVTPMGKRDAASDVSASSLTPTLDSVARDVTDDARQGRIDPMIGRDKEIERVIHILRIKHGKAQQLGITISSDIKK